MISAPLGDFRHTMHIGRGGDAFGDTSFLSTLGPPPANSDSTGSQGDAPPADPQEATTYSGLYTDGPASPENSELQHSESVSSFTLDLDLDLGPSMLGDVLGVMDGLGLDDNEDDLFGGTSSVGAKQGKAAAAETSVDIQNELNGKNSVGLDRNQTEESRIADGNGSKPKGLRPKVRFSDKREEIIRQVSEEDEVVGQAFDFQEEDHLGGPGGPAVAENERGHVIESAGEPANHHVEDEPPSPASSHSSDYEGVTSLDRRRSDRSHSETESEEEEEEVGRGYTFEDEFDDEIGL